MKWLRNILLFILGIILVITIVSIGLIVKEQNENIYDFQFTTFSHKDVNDFEVVPLNDSISVKQPFIAEGEILNYFIFFIRYSAYQTDKSGEIIINITDTDGNIVSENILDCRGIPDEEWFGYQVDVNVPIIFGNVYYINLKAVNTENSKFELRMVHSNQGTKMHFPNMVYEENAQKDNVLVMALSFTKQITKVIPDSYRNMLELLGIYNILFVIAIIVLNIIIMRNKSAKIVYDMPIPIYFFVVMAIVFVGICGYLQIRPWYISAPPVAHALGDVNGDSNTNSKEALEQSINLGFCYLEADFCMTSDGFIVLRHDWGYDGTHMGFPKGYVPTLNEFKSRTIDNRYTPLSLLDLLEIMDKNPDIYIITDSKEGDFDAVVEHFTKFVETAIENGYENVLKRFIVQIYNDDMLYAIESVYSFDNYIYTLYQRGTTDIDQLIDFCRQNNIHVITVFDLWWYEQPEFREAIKESGLTIYVHTVNDIEEAQDLEKDGVTNVYTDSISPHNL